LAAPVHYRPATHRSVGGTRRDVVVTPGSS
jgi:hypothetical protein